jgi:hypothetical protein
MRLLCPPAVHAMSSTRQADAAQWEKRRAQKQHWRAGLSAEKKVKIRKRETKLAQDRRRQLIDHAANGAACIRELNAQARRLSLENSELKERVEELSKYELQFEEEPDVQDADAKNVHLLYEFAYSKPRLFEQLTGETPKSFDELFELGSQQCIRPLQEQCYTGRCRQQRLAQHAGDEVYAGRV